MAWRISLVGIFLVLVAAATWPLSAQQPDINELYEKAAKEAARKVAPSVVQIQTQGGSDMVVTGIKGASFRKALGPTTGVIIDPDGYIISSAFNFSNNPASIIVLVPGNKEPMLAKKIATDKSRMLTLLKIDKTGLPVPDFVPNSELRVGQSSLALGRTLDPKVVEMSRDQSPSVSYGIISALHRIWGKAIQTDAKISPINYGGPLVDMAGRVQGIIIPASPRGDDVTAGFEWYDSGIGFAVPMEDVMAVLPRLKKGKDLEKATLGVKMKGQDQYSAVPEIVAVLPESAADKAGLKAGDVITEIEGKQVINQAQILHVLGPKYAGDSIALKVRRGKEDIAVAKVDLMGPPKAGMNPPSFLGILAVRDDPKLGVEIRYVYPQSPAEMAGFKQGDRIIKYDVKMLPEIKDKDIDKGIDKQPKGKKAAPKEEPPQFMGMQRGRDELANFLDWMPPGTEITLSVVGKDGTVRSDVPVTLAAMPGSVPNKEDFVPEKLPALASLKKALEPLESINPKAKAPAKKDGKGEAKKAAQPKKQGEGEGEAKKAETGMIKRTSTAGDRKYWIYVDKEYNPQISHAVVVWLHLPGMFSDDDNEKVADRWDEYCHDNHIILVGPLTEQEGGWTPSDTELVLEAVRDVSDHYTVDTNRIVVHGQGNGGQMAFNLGFRARETFRGVAALGAVMTEPQDNIAGQRLAFYVGAGDRDPVVKAIAETRAKLVEHRFAVCYRVFPKRGREYLDEKCAG